jgi:hypothetical protein
MGVSEATNDQSLVRGRVDVFGLIWFWRARTGERRGALTTLTPDPNNRIGRREQILRMGLGVANIILGILNIWVGLGHRG